MGTDQNLIASQNVGATAPPSSDGTPLPSGIAEEIED